MQTVNGRYSFEEYMQAITDAGAYAQSNGTQVSSPGIAYEVANSTAAVPSTRGYVVLSKGHHHAEIHLMLSSFRAHIDLSYV